MKLHARSIIRCQGRGAANFLHGLTTQDVLGKVQENPTRSFAAGFLNAKGRVLCDSIIFPRSHEEFYLDVHQTLAPQMHRLLKRHTLRDPIEIDIMPDWSVVWDQVCPSTSSGGSSSSTSSARASADGQEDADPRNAHLGCRRIVPTQDADALPSGDELFFKRRLLCGIPEGPDEIPTAKALPLNYNFDLNNFISFRKGCYVGQELTHRSFHVGKIRKRLCRLIHTDQDFDAALPVPEELLTPTDVLPLNGEYDDNEICEPVEGEEKEWRACGEIITVHENVGLALFSSQKHSMNAHDQILKAMQGTRYFRGELLLLKPPLLQPSLREKF